MCKSLFIISFLLCFMLNAKANSFSYCSSFASDSTEIILALKKNDTGNYAKVRNAITSMPGINFRGYCNNHSVFLLYIKNNDYGGAEKFLELLLQADPTINSLIFLKKGSIKDLLNHCQFSNPNDAAANKQ